MSKFLVTIAILAASVCGFTTEAAAQISGSLCWNCNVSSRPIAPAGHFHGWHQQRREWIMVRLEEVPIRYRPASPPPTRGTVTRAPATVVNGATDLGGGRCRQTEDIGGRTGVWLNGIVGGTCRAKL